ncbi:MAG: MFS transporter [Rhodanobacteraceae bacterium]
MDTDTAKSDTVEGLPAPVIALQDWFRRDIELPLANIVGGPARLKVIVLLAAVLGMDAADKATVGAVAAPLEHAFHIGDVQIGLLVTVATAVGALATLPFGILVDRMNRTRLLTAAIVVWSVAMAVSAFSTSYPMMLLCRLALGAIVAVAAPAVASLTGDFFHPGERGRIYGYILAGELVGVAFGFLISGNVAAFFSWRVSFWLLAALGFLLGFVIWRFLPEPRRGSQGTLAAADSRAADGADAKPDDETKIAERIEERGIAPRESQVLSANPETMSLWQAIRYVLSIRTYKTLIIASALGYFYFIGLRTFALVFVRDRFGLAQSAASMVSVGVGLGAIVGVLLAGRLADRLIERGWINGRIITGAAAYLLATAALLPGLFIGSLYVAAPFFFVAATGLGGANPAVDSARLDIMHSRLWGRAEGVRATVLYALQAIAPPLFGYVASLFGGADKVYGQSATHGVTVGGGLDMAFLVMLAPLFLAGLVLLRALKTYPRDVATAIASERRTPEKS